MLLLQGRLLGGLKTHMHSSLWVPLWVTLLPFHQTSGRTHTLWPKAHPSTCLTGYDSNAPAAAPTPSPG